MRKPGYHYRPEANWINDPNGLCQVNGWYHMFYQYNPGGAVWGDIHWGHARSRDLIRWETLPIALAPDAARGEKHCFSGSCCKDAQGKPWFFYTSIGDELAGRGSADGAQQWLARPADGGLLRLVQTDAFALTDDIHGGVHVREWRAPCVIPWQGRYLMVLGGCLEGRGCVLLYTSPDLLHWTYSHVLAQADVADGVPWECPNFFPLGDKFVLFYSPCAQVMARVGTLDEALRFHCETEEVLDPAQWQGYYAPQAFRDETGRMVLFGWMPDCDGELALEKGWSGVMSLPRVLRIEGGCLRAEPAPEVDSLAGWHTVEAPAGESCLAEDGTQLLLRMTCDVRHAPLTLRLFAGAAGEALLTLTPQGALTLDRSRSSSDGRISRTPISRQVALKDGLAEVFLALDCSTVECCVNGQWLSGRVYPDKNSRGVWLKTDRPVQVRLGLIRPECVR